MPEIANVDAWEALDSRGRPTVACCVTLSEGTQGVAAVPSGASTGRHEARELRDGDERYGGFGVRAAAGHVRGELAAAVVGRLAGDQRAVDDALRRADGTRHLERLGANAVLAVSVATARASAASHDQPLWQVIGSDPLLPLPMVNIVSGGAHADGLIDIQDILAVPVGATSFAEAIEWAGRVRLGTARAAEELGIVASLVADEGGIAGRLPNNRAALELVARGVEASGLVLGEEIGLALDIAATQLLTADGRYRLETEDRTLDAVELVDEIAAWCAAFPLVSVEDLLGEDDWEGWRYASQQLRTIQVLGDDLFVTQLDRLDRGVEDGIANAVLVKVNQNGTLTGGLDVVTRARAAAYAPVISARSGETEDTWIADLAVGSRAGQIKVGSTTRSERTAKWNRLLQLEHQLAGSNAGRYAGPAALAPYGG
ncbi:phosphopyruvate hydratase [Actinobacteria bacterium YIM 96077]|uniref:Enolase n=2 Tax=Phytoactinopolyspora halophila TaxID=1981511 RepID=A0A329QCH2_9ACTN|nr:phosphopyruvate hydratase [Actinobacteria bacterium YIM 96077]RAW10083.1 phosphopyruvate hydratase [Phytoactinopolyspora halophila]